MAILNPTQLSAEAQVIATETTAGANTAARIGGMFQDIVDSAVFSVKRTLSSAEILQLFTTPITLVAAPGAGKVVRPLALYLKLNYNSVPYDTNVNLRVNVGTLLGVVLATSYLGQSTTAYSFYNTSGVNTATDPTNTACTIAAQTGNPLNGNSTVDVVLTYCILSV